MKRILIATTALLGVVVAQNSWAATTTTAIGVDAGVGASCSVSATRLAFHSVVDSTPGDGTATITVNCTSGADYDIGLDTGLTPTGPQRFLVGANPLHKLSYNLFQDSGRSVAWGDTVGVDTFAGTGAGAPQVIPVYGRVPSQTVATDIYGDTVTVTVTY